MQKIKLITVIMILTLMCGCAKLEPGMKVQLTVPEGSSTKAIATKLKDAGLISSELLFVNKVKSMEAANSLKHGDYEFVSGMTDEEIIERLIEGAKRTDIIKFTVPEGFSVNKIIARAVEAGLATEEEMLAALDKDYNYDFLDKIPEDSGVYYRLEGFLFPDTYEFTSDSTAEDVINTMLAQFEKKTANLVGNDGDLYETIIKASLIEREAKIASERETISGVIENRLSIGMRLQIDASVSYATTGGMYDSEIVTYNDLEVISEYNTYRNEGLPPGPICCPGVASIEAALNPEQHEYLYYHTDNEKKDGSHVFTKTFEEHRNTK